MDILLSRVTQQAMNYAIRSGITITTTYAIKQCGRLLKEAPRSQDREELLQLQLRLENKIRIISPAIEMIELISARGNTSLETAASLTKDIRYDIQRLGSRLNNAANDEELLKRKSSRAKSREQAEHELRAIIAEMKSLLTRIEDAIPLINLAITTSGVNMSTQLSGSISTSRLLQASTFLTAADSKYAVDPWSRQQVGPTYTLSLYMLFASHAWRPVDEAGIRQTTWKEVIHKARVKLLRVPYDQADSLPGVVEHPNGRSAEILHDDAKASEFAYQLVLVEDLDDDRVHTFEENEPQPGPYDEVMNAGIRDVVPVYQVSKIFYADTGKILNIGGDTDVHNPVLLLKRDPTAEPPRKLLYKSQIDDAYFDLPCESGGPNGVQVEVDAQLARESQPSTPTKQDAPSARSTSAWRLPPDLDPEWMAFEVYVEEPDSELEEDEPALPARVSSPQQSTMSSELAEPLSRLKLNSSASLSPSVNSRQRRSIVQSPHGRPISQPIKSTLSLLEMLLKLTAVQQFRQDSHLTIEDELLNFFLKENATAGAGFDKDRRQRIRHDAIRRVGFDPYDESPIKRHNEEYIQRAAAEVDTTRHLSPPRLAYEDMYGDHYEDQHSVAEELEQPSSPLGRGRFLHEAVQSSPSPPPALIQQTPSRSPSGSVSSERHRMFIEAKYAKGQGLAGPMQTPPSTARSREAFLRSMSEPKPRSPLAKEAFRSRDQDAEARRD